MPPWVWLILATRVAVGVIPLHPRRPTLHGASVPAPMCAGTALAA